MLICVLLSALTLAAYWPVFHNDFIRLDDPDYVTENGPVLAGLNWHSAVWAFCASHSSNWHPLTWLSHMLDVQLFALNATGHHLTSLLFHLANTSLLFIALRRMTSALWRSAFVAAIFAVHPLHVESIAWVAERKDVLSTLFFMLTLWTYARYTEDTRTNAESRMQNPASSITSTLPSTVHSPQCYGRWGSPFTFHVSRVTPPSCLFYVISLFFFALGLMSKPMLVTLPFVLLLLDFWPLGRLCLPTSQNSSTPILRLMFEKLPFFVLSAISSLITYLVQDNTHALLRAIPLGPRLANAIASYIKYLGKTVWPVDLAVFYPHPDIRYPISNQWPLWQILASALLLAAFSGFVLCRLKRQPWLATGWFWYLGTLVPVIGLVQVGGQAMADRYSYIPLIGVFICCVWSLAELCAGCRSGRMALAGGGALALAVCVALTRTQAGYWRNNSALFEHALAVTASNPPAHFVMGWELAREGKYELALPHFRAAVEADPNYAEAQRELGLALSALGKPDEAVAAYQAALRLNQSDLLTHNRLGATLWLQGKRAEAQAEFREAVRICPTNAEAHANLAYTLLESGQTNEAAACFATSRQLDPALPERTIQEGRTLAAQGKLEDALARFTAAARLQPENVEAYQHLGLLYAQQGRLAEAISEFREQLRLQPDAQAWYNLGLTCVMLGKLSEAAANYEQAVKLKPDWPIALNDLAWLRATVHQAELRDGAEAVRLAERACELTGGKEARFLGTLDAAYAEAGRFADAIKTASRARALAAAAGDNAISAAAEQRLALYLKQQPYRQ